MPFTGLETFLSSTVCTFVGVAAGKIWSTRGKVDIERCSLIHKRIDEKLEEIKEEIKRAGNGKPR